MDCVVWTIGRDAEPAVTREQLEPPRKQRRVIASHIRCPHEGSNTGLATDMGVSAGFEPQRAIRGFGPLYSSSAVTAAVRSLRALEGGPTGDEEAQPIASSCVRADRRRD